METEQYFPDVFCRNCISNELINGGGGGKQGTVLESGEFFQSYYANTIY